MDELKKYLQKHAPELDGDEPGPGVWENIARETTAPKKPATILVFTRWAAAACILVLAGIGTWHIINDNRKTENPVVLAKTGIEKKIIVPEPVQKETIEEPETNTIAKTSIQSHPNKPKPNNPINQNPVNSESTLEVLSNVENSFTQVINLQRERISSMPMYAETPAYFNDFSIQIRQMEKDEKTIKSDIAKRGMTDESLNQLINLYQQKLNILKQLQIEMNKTNNHFKQNHSPVDSTRTYFLNI